MEEIKFAITGEERRLGIQVECHIMDVADDLAYSAHDFEGRDEGWRRSAKLNSRSWWSCREESMASGTNESQATRTDTEKSAAAYAWDYFQYHAGQRQAVFRFFLTLVGLATLAYGYSLRNSGLNSGASQETLRLLIGALLIIISFLFWRLDKRSQCLIKHSEAALKKVEVRLASALNNDETIKLMHRSDEKVGGFFALVESFRQIYAIVFSLVGLAGAVLIFLHFLR